MAMLIGMSADVKGKNFTLSDEPLTLGRSADNKVHLDNASVSGHHASIAREGERFILRDLGSTNGTRVNAREIKEATLKPKDLVQIGSVEFLFNAEGAGGGEEAPEESFTATEVLVAEGPAARPESFDNISPFGARRRENQGVWTVIIAVVGVLTLAVVGFFLYRLFTAQ